MNRDPEIALLFPTAPRRRQAQKPSQPDSARRLRYATARMVRWSACCACAIQRQVQATVELTRRSGCAPASTEGEEAGRLLLVEGDEFTIKVCRNMSPQPVFVHIIDLASDGSITPVFPRDIGSANFIKAGGIWEDTNRTSIGNVPVVRDVVKIILSTEPIETRGLLQGT